MQTQTGVALEQEDEEAKKWVVVVDGLQFVLEVECEGAVADLLLDNYTTDLLAGVPMVDINGWYVARDRIVAVVHKSVFKGQRPKAQFA